MKYMVMECHSGYAVVLDEEGRFLKTANLHYEVGQTVTDVVEVELPQFRQQPRRRNSRRILSAFAAMAACLAIVVTGLFFGGQMPYASVYLTINPEVRIDVNRTDVVVGVEGMNPDGADLLEGYDYHRKDLNLVMDELVDRAIDMDYLHEGGRISLRLDADEEWVTSHGEHLNQHLSDHLTDKLSVTIDLDQPGAAQPTAPAGTIVIPVGPEHYGESDYGSSDEGSSDYGSPDDEDSGYDDSDEDERDEEPEDNRSDYEDPDTDEDGQSPYDDGDDGQTDYGTSQTPENGSSDYEAPDPEDSPSDYAQKGDSGSDYEEPDDDDD